MIQGESLYFPNFRRRLDEVFLFGIDHFNGFFFFWWRNSDTVHLMSGESGRGRMESLFFKVKPTHVGSCALRKREIEGSSPSGGSKE